MRYAAPKDLDACIWIADGGIATIFGTPHNQAIGMHLSPPWIQGSSYKIAVGDSDHLIDQRVDQEWIKLDQIGFGIQGSPKAIHGAYWTLDTPGSTGITQNPIGSIRMPP